MLSREQLHLIFRTLNVLTWDELAAAGVISANDHRSWCAFRANTLKWWMLANDETRDRLFVLVAATLSRSPAVEFQLPEVAPSS